MRIARQLPSCPRIASDQQPIFKATKISSNHFSYGERSNLLSTLLALFLLLVHPRECIIEKHEIIPLAVIQSTLIYLSDANKNSRFAGKHDFRETIPNLDPAKISKQENSNLICEVLHVFNFALQKKRLALWSYYCP